MVFGRWETCCVIISAIQFLNRKSCDQLETCTCNLTQTRSMEDWKNNRIDAAAVDDTGGMGQRLFVLFTASFCYMYLRSTWKQKALQSIWFLGASYIFLLTWMCYEFLWNYRKFVTYNLEALICVFQRSCWQLLYIGELVCLDKCMCKLVLEGWHLKSGKVCFDIILYRYREIWYRCSYFWIHLLKRRDTLENSCQQFHILYFPFLCRGVGIRANAL